MSEFTVTDEHLKLLDNVNIGWMDMEHGAPCVDPKRPYGNSDVHGDMAEILDGDTIAGMRDGARDDFMEDNADRYDRLHREMETVLRMAIDHYVSAQRGESDGE